MSYQLNIFDGVQASLDAPSEAIELPDASLQYVASFIPVVQRGRLFDELMKATPWTQDKIVMFGRQLHVPRMSAWHGDAGTGYTYSNIELHPLVWTPPLLHIKAAVEMATGERFNSVLVNLYRDGADSVAWHADDEPELGAEPLIASVSLGAPRTFKLKHQTDPSLRHSMELTDGSLLIMRGSTQQCWMHEVPKTAKRIGARINLTFRTVLTSIRTTGR